MSDTRKIVLTDRLASHDKVDAVINSFRKGIHRPTFRTAIEMTNEFGEVIFSQESNETVLGGALTVLEKLCNVKSSLKVGSINSIMGINDTVPAADSSAGNDDVLCLWGVGIGGSGDAFGSRRVVKFQEREVGQNGHPEQMLPFRVVPDPFDATDVNASKYFMMRQRADGYYEYFLKAFEIDPIIKVLYKDGAEGEDGTEVESNVYETTREDGIEAFVEIHLAITRNDIREYFERTGEIEMARFNSIALFTGRLTEISEGRYDYTNVKMFSKLNIDNESLQAAKSLNIIYKIYVS
jgi:hypothetical protein